MCMHCLRSSLPLTRWTRIHNPPNRSLRHHPNIISQHYDEDNNADVHLVTILVFGSSSPDKVDPTPDRMWLFITLRFTSTTYTRSVQAILGREQTDLHEGDLPYSLLYLL